MRKLRNRFVLKAAGALATLTFMVSVASQSVLASEYENGAYLVPTLVSYANPVTGEVVDGGSNVALGDSMSQSITESEALVEVWEEETYVTLGLGLASNIGDTSILVETIPGSNEYHTVELTQTGSCERAGDVCNHYRFPVESPESLISPVLYVTPMGREVQFFIQLDMENKAEGTADYVSEIIEERSAQAAREASAAEGVDESQETDASKEESSTEKSKEAALKEIEPDAEEDEETTKTTKQESDESIQEDKESNKKENGKTPIFIISGIAGVVVIAGAVLLIKKGRK